MIHFTPYCPSFINNGESAEGPCAVTSLAELNRHPQVRRFLDSGHALHVAIEGPAEALLVGQAIDEHWVVGGLKGDVSMLDLPDYQPKEQTMKHKRPD